MKNTFLCLITSLLTLAGASQPELKAENLIPSTPGKAPDYFSTWNVQGYVLSYAKGKLRDAMTESNMFGSGKYQNWVDFYPRIRSDLYFVMGGNTLTLPGQLIERIGLELATHGDKSDPGLVILISGVQPPVASASAKIEEKKN